MSCAPQESSFVDIPKLLHGVDATPNLNIKFLRDRRDISAIPDMEKCKLQRRECPDRFRSGNVLGRTHEATQGIFLRCRSTMAPGIEHLLCILKESASHVADKNARFD
jgi:hypothetical protein